MRHLLLLLVLAVVGYAAHQLMNPVERRHASRALTRHGLRLAAIVLVILLLLAAAVHLPSSNIF
jgi:uncharacterized membrane protein YdjX (TVP38/TMEM64 family)